MENEVCPNCGGVVIRRGKQWQKIYCSPKCQQESRMGLPMGKRSLLNYLMERDHGRCGKCYKPIRAKKGERRPSIGHIIPVALGGQNVLENLQAEHLECNRRAGRRGGGEQLLLVG